MGLDVALSEILDDGRDGATMAESDRSSVSRLVLATLVGVLLWTALSWRAALAWAAVSVALEIVMHICKVSFLRNQGDRRRTRWQRLLPAASFSAAWSGMAMGCWIYGSEPLRFGAMLVLFGILLEAVKYAALSRAAFLAILPFPTAALIAAPLFFGWFGGERLLFVLGAMSALGLCLFHVARALRANALALEKAQAEAEEASRAKSAFLAMMSHELRTPMNGVLGMAHALAATNLSRQQANYLDMIVQSGDGLMAILNDILDLSKIEAGKLELEAVPFEIGKLGRQLFVLWSETARQKGVELSLEIDPATPAWLVGDPVRVRQILLNLISNALKFTEQGSVAVRIAPGHGGGIEIWVADSGIGMTEGEQARLFQAFSQGETSTARRFGGTGLGLSICRQLVEMMRGEIAVQSRKGEGSTFRVKLPLPAAEAQLETVAPLQLANLDRRRILVVDDNAVNLAVARAIMEATGAEVVTADDGLDALEKLRNESFDVVLMDVHMPRMDGIEALKHIRQGLAGRADLPVIALTADAMSGAGDRLLEEGFDDVHPKPIQPAGLMQVVATWCSRPVTLPRKSA
jgi:signal transduction histidine kinase/BarA-like signal transduction histidine kinase